MAYRDWETHLCERHAAEARSGALAPLPALRQRRPIPPNALNRTAGRPSWRVPRGHTSVGICWLQHKLNALHLMDTLVRWGVPRPWALTLARCWERISRAWLYAAES